MPKIKVHNVETNEVIEREMNDEELEQYKKDVAQFALDKKAKEEAEAKRAALLAKLGITEEEAKLLLS